MSDCCSFLKIRLTYVIGKYSTNFSGAALRKSENSFPSFTSKSGYTTLSVAVREYGTELWQVVVKIDVTGRLEVYFAESKTCSLHAELYFCVDLDQKF